MKYIFVQTMHTSVRRPSGTGFRGVGGASLAFPLVPPPGIGIRRPRLTLLPPDPPHRPVGGTQKGIEGCINVARHRAGLAPENGPRRADLR